MPNQGFLKLGLIDVDTVPITDANVNIELFRASDRQKILQFSKLKYPPPRTLSGALISHVLDLFKHKVTGGTHPFDIHEILRLMFHHPLGYTLV